MGFRLRCWDERLVSVFLVGLEVVCVCVCVCVCVRERERERGGAEEANTTYDDIISAHFAIS